MAGKKHRVKMKTEEPDLSPIMSILCILIPVLLFAFSFVEIKVQAVSAPRMGSGKAKKQDDDAKKPLNLTVLITSKGFVVKQQAELTTEPDPPIFKRTMTDRDGVEHEDMYDFPTLYSKIMEKKKAYPDENTINIGAEMDIPWHVLARTIDAARVQLEKDAYQNLAEYETAKPKKNEDKQPMSMFDGVIFVVAE
jgi:hypothetical protein